MRFATSQNITTKTYKGNGITLMDDRNYDFSTLSERISAQTQAYVEFSNALVKIIEQTASIRDSVNDTNNHLLEDYRELNTKFQTLLVDLNKFFSDNKNEHSHINRDITSLKNTLESFEEDLNGLIEQMEDNNNRVFGLIQTLVDNSKNNKELATTETNSQQASINALIAKIENQSKVIASFQKSIDKSKVFIWAAGGLITLIGVLSQFGILKILWFSK